MRIILSQISEQAEQAAEYTWRDLLWQAQTWLLDSGWRIALIIILLLFAVRFTKSISSRYFAHLAKGKDQEFQKRAQTLSDVVTGLLIFLWIVVAAVMVLGQLDVPIAPIITTLGVGGLAIGFGGQYIIRDVINGFFILYDDQIRVGDVAQIAGKGGLVEHVGLRLTKLRDFAGSVHYVRNGEIGVVTNMTKDFSRCVFDIGVAYREDVDEVIEVVKKLGDEMQADDEFGEHILEPIEILGLDQFADSAIIIKARFKTKPIKQWMIAREFNRRLKKRFDELDIEIPFPHTTLYIGEDKQGKAAPLRLEQTSK